jgi:hypothetical protein
MEIIEFVRQISQTLSYLSKRTDRDYYTMLFPEGMQLPYFLNIPRNKKVKKWLKRLYDGYIGGRGYQVWMELRDRNRSLFEKVLKIFFPKTVIHPFRLHDLERALFIWKFREDRLSLISLARYVIENKDEMVLKYEKLFKEYEQWFHDEHDMTKIKELTDKLIKEGVVRKHFKREEDRVAFYFIPMPYFYHISILIHCYIAQLLHETFFEEEWRIQKQKKAILNELLILAIAGEPLPSKEEVKRRLRKLESEG